MKKILATCCLLLLTSFLFAQDVEMADGMRSSGKIYVVVGGLITILLGILLFLIILDRKVSDIEKRIGKQ